MPLVPVSALVLRTQTGTGTSGHDTGRDAEQDVIIYTNEQTVVFIP